MGAIPKRCENCGCPVSPNQQYCDGCTPTFPSVNLNNASSSVPPTIPPSGVVSPALPMPTPKTNEPPNALNSRPKKRYKQSLIVVGALLAIFLVIVLLGYLKIKNDQEYPFISLGENYCSNLGQQHSDTAWGYIATRNTPHVISSNQLQSNFDAVAMHHRGFARCSVNNVTQISDLSASFSITYTFGDKYQKRQDYDAFYYDGAQSWKINADGFTNRY